MCGSVVGVLILIITGVLYFAAQRANLPHVICVGRATAFFFGSLFSASVGFFGMRMATVGNLRVAAAAKTSFGQALQLGYRTGTITGTGSDLLVMGAYGRGQVLSFLGMGGATGKVISSCRVPLLLAH